MSKMSRDKRPLDSIRNIIKIDLYILLKLNYAGTATFEFHYQNDSKLCAIFVRFRTTKKQCYKISRCSRI